MAKRTFVISRHYAGRTLAELLKVVLRLPPPMVAQQLRHRHVRVGDAVCTDPHRRLRPGQRIEVNLPDRPATGRAKTAEVRPLPSLPPIAEKIRLVHADSQILVIEKPAGLTTVRHADEAEAFGVRARRHLPPTLVDLLPRVLPAKYRKGRIRAVHRLDKDTSGLVVLARTAEAESKLGKAFRAHEVERTYLALVRGQAKSERIDSRLVKDRGDGRRGSSLGGAGQRAVTHVRVVEKLGDFTLVECSLETGRTHQVRIHLGECGTPLCGERIYDRRLHGQPPPDTSAATRPLLHAATLALAHPLSGETLAWNARLPADMAGLLAHLRINLAGSD